MSDAVEQVAGVARRIAERAAAARARWGVAPTGQARGVPAAVAVQLACCWFASASGERMAQKVLEAAQAGDLAAVAACREQIAELEADLDQTIERLTALWERQR